VQDVLVALAFDEHAALMRLMSVPAVELIHFARPSFGQEPNEQWKGPLLLK
jgi:hypothetical protein